MYTVSVAIDGSPTEWRTVKTYNSDKQLMADALSWRKDPALYGQRKRIVRDSDGQLMDLTPYGELVEAL
jgi:hypothetical protein